MKRAAVFATFVMGSWFALALLASSYCVRIDPLPQMTDGRRHVSKAYAMPKTGVLVFETLPYNLKREGESAFPKYEAAQSKNGVLRPLNDNEVFTAFRASARKFAVAGCLNHLKQIPEWLRKSYCEDLIAHPDFYE